MNKIVTVNFRGSELIGFQSGPVVLVAVKPIVEAMGLDWSSQYKRIQREPILAEGMVMMTIPFGPGGAQRMVCLNLELIHGWLFKIDTHRIKNTQVRETVLFYQRECYRALFSHFSGDRERLAKEANDADSLSLRLVMECRHIWGNRSAAELWEKRGLPKVASMNDVFRQYSLFDAATLVPQAERAA
jgi:P22_AR N-terminal domain